MTSAAPPADPSPRPSIFLSYASADRVAARALRDTLSAAGLDVWLDEDELGGGEAWDTKIRNQIRTCTYFMPLISATTEVRGEGYFRREWRLAVERTLDLADDILFLVPIVIDDTRDAGARVPEKFFSVQWLRVPGGKSTAALTELAEKLGRGDAVAIPPSPAGPVPTTDRSRRKTRTPEQGPPPFPNFPAFPEPGHRVRFCYNLVLWGGHMLLSLWGHLPKFFRIVAAIFIIFNLITWAFRESKASRQAEEEKATPTEINPHDVIIAGHTLTPGEKTAVSGAIESALGAAAEVLQSGRPLAVIKFSGEGDRGETLADDVFKRFLKFLKAEDNLEASASPIRLKADATDSEIIDRGQRLKSQFVLSGFTRAATADHPLSFTAKLYDVKLAKLIWTESYDSPPADGMTIAQRLAIEVEKRTAPAKSAD